MAGANPRLGVAETRTGLRVPVGPPQRDRGRFGTEGQTEMGRLGRLRLGLAGCDLAFLWGADQS